MAKPTITPKANSVETCDEKIPGRCRRGIYWLVNVNGKWIREHRYVMEQHLGRKLRSDEIVHHKDENGRNNSIENLVIMTRGDHRREHAKNFASKTHKQCSKCKEIKLRTEFHVKRGSRYPDTDPHRPECKQCGLAYKRELYHRAPRPPKKYCKGEESPVAKLTEAKVLTIRQLLSQGVSPKECARQFNVCVSTIHAVRKRLVWKHI
jgi:hypothetical protein